jgi:hypothetical protein
MYFRLALLFWGIPQRNQEILKQVQDDKGWTFYKGWTVYSGGAFRFAINKDTIPRSEILKQVQDDGGEDSYNRWAPPLSFYAAILKGTSSS